MKYLVMKSLDDWEDVLDAQFLEMEHLTMEEVIDMICSEGRFPKTSRGTETLQ
ncbi:hypothetical protein [Methyloceanibacter caenitepidi]|uniref:Uncharacterized protein n=1 Tax=Methyloceanibacter caenitepidi TaxID=1384459 RepID=A0A0A8K5X5_9HYPH|nr:hypothetical protein [Methyloceanibacter caenitepidi]BAQ17922.1 hypothetical protein GL4_2488 [Methyloceanibacter caenitepidi]